MDSITIDGMEEMEFRRSIETMLRRGEADEAANRLKTLLEGYAGEGRILPARFLSVNSDEIRLEGWDELESKLHEYDRPEAAMSAISIDILDPQGIGVRPDAQGLLKPVMETSYFSDSAYPFSEADREDLLDGYSSFGCEWQGNFENVDTTITVEGIDDLYGATVGLENRVASGGAGLEDIQAGSIGSCYLAVLIHKAIRDTARDKGLPRPICVIAGSNDAYPFFDAPAMTVEEYRQQGGFMPLEENAALSGSGDEFAEGCAQAGDGMGSLESLMGLGAKKKEKKPVLTIDPSEADTSESLELANEMDMPVEMHADPEDRQHIMPSVHLDDAPDSGPVHEPHQPDWSEWDSDPAEEAGQAPAAPEEWAARTTQEPTAVPETWEPAPPAEIEEPDAAPVPIDFSAYEEPAEPANVTPVPVEQELPVPGFGGDLGTPIDFEAFEQPAPAGFGEEEAPAPLDRFNSEDEQPEPLDRLPSEQAPAPPAEPVHNAPPSGEWGEPEAPAQDTSDREFAAGRLADDEFAEAPGRFPDAGLDESPAEPFDLDAFMEPEELAPEDRAADFDPPVSHETGDNTGWETEAPPAFDAPAVHEPPPARHSIRAKAAMVTNEGTARSTRPAASSESLVVRMILGIAKMAGWLRKALGRR